MQVQYQQFMMLFRINTRTFVAKCFANKYLTNNSRRHSGYSAEHGNSINYYRRLSARVACLSLPKHTTCTNKQQEELPLLAHSKRTQPKSRSIVPHPISKAFATLCGTLKMNIGLVSNNLLAQER